MSYYTLIADALEDVLTQGGKYSAFEQSTPLKDSLFKDNLYGVLLEVRKRLYKKDQRAGELFDRVLNNKPLVDQLLKEIREVTPDGAALRLAKAVSRPSGDSTIGV